MIAAQFEQHCSAKYTFLLINDHCNLLLPEKNCAVFFTK